MCDERLSDHSKLLGTVFEIAWVVENMIFISFINNLHHQQVKNIFNFHSEPCGKLFANQHIWSFLSCDK